MTAFSAASPSIVQRRVTASPAAMAADAPPLIVKLSMLNGSTASMTVTVTVNSPSDSSSTLRASSV